MANQIVDKALAWLGKLFIIKYYTASYSVPANGYTDINASMLNASASTGYTPMGVLSWHTGNNGLVPIIINPWNDSQYFRIRNYTTTAVNNAPIYVRMLYAKSGVIQTL